MYYLLRNDRFLSHTQQSISCSADWSFIIWSLSFMLVCKVLSFILMLFYVNESRGTLGRVTPLVLPCLTLLSLLLPSSQYVLSCHMLMCVCAYI